MLDGDPAPLPKKGGTAPNFRPISIVAKRLDGSICHLVHCARWGPSSPPLAKKGTVRQFSADVYCGQTAVCIRIPLGKEVHLSLGDIVLDGDTAPPPLKGHSPQFSVHVRYGQTAEWTQTPLDMEVGPGPGDFVLDGNPAPQKKGHSPQFSAHVYCGQTAGWITIERSSS